MIDTDDPLLSEPAQRRATKRRNVTVTVGTAILTAVVLMAVVDGLGLVDAVGVDSGTVRASEGSTTLNVEFPAVSRPGLASPLSITIEEAGGFSTDTVDVAVDLDYLAMWDFNGMIPVPAGETADGERAIWTFDTPDDEVLTIKDQSLTGGFLGAGTIGFWVATLGWITYRSEKARRVVEGVPLILVSDGEPVSAALAAERLPLSEVMEAARQEGVVTLEEIRLAVLEVNGRISIIPR